MSVKSCLLEALDVLASSRSSVTRRTKALDALERLLAQICAGNSETDQTDVEAFLILQESFECNVASRLIYNVSTWLHVLQEATSSMSTQYPTAPEVLPTTHIIMQSLSILQGIALLHYPSKDFLGKKWCIQVFIDLLAVSWHLAPTPLSSSTNVLSPATSASSAPTLASSSIDTLLCVLVDSPAAMRAFEAADGVEVIVKTLKRTGVARDIRIKCLEFLYFYLLDETGEISVNSGTKHRTAPLNPTSRDTISFLPPATLHTSAPSSLPPSPEGSPPTIPRNLGMLQKDIDFVPVTPKKVQVLRLGAGTPRASHHRTPRSVPSPTKRGRVSPADISVTPASPNKRRIAPERSSGELHEELQRVRRKSTQEKKELLGNLLGNVESLVETVAKSGIWGLG